MFLYLCVFFGIEKSAKRIEVMAHLEGVMLVFHNIEQLPDFKR